MIKYIVHLWNVADRMVIFMKYIYILFLLSLCFIICLIHLIDNRLDLSFIENVLVRGLPADEC